MHYLKRNYLEGALGASVGLAGEYRLVVREADGTVARDTGWFDNLILDAGLNRIGTGDWVGTCVIGTGTTAPAAGQTQLSALSSSAASVVGAGTIYGALATSPYYSWRQLQYRFDLGALNGNYTEVGVGWGATTLFSRALIVDGGGSPVAIAVNSTQQLDVFYRLRSYPDLNDASGSFTVAGASGGTINFTRRAAFLPFYPGTGQLGQAFAANGANINSYGAGATLGAITDGPTGTVVSGPFGVNQASYVNNSYQRDATLDWPLEFGNAGGGIGGLRILTSHCYWQYAFATPIAKTSTRTLSLVFRMSWARRP
jgi:hypothetical protein